MEKPDRNQDGDDATIDKRRTIRLKVRLKRDLKCSGSDGFAWTGQAGRAMDNHLCENPLVKLRKLLFRAQKELLLR
ncbi:unnamed protein product [Nippostrongylus brasiliensis]|uniref:Uncharacterized protein n=1 Tax=Nippostrongylus brasiliensis TaxID=27835 RepID=A0A0N4YD55_NIPBR|nr:unnamed protein product [Nippostrongylus brasiliensis]